MKSLATLELFKTRRERAEELITFSNSLSTLLSSGVPISRAVGVLSRQKRGTSYNHICQAIESDIERGARLADCVSKHPLLFPDFFVSMVRTAEEVGGLGDALKNLEKHYSRRLDWRKNLRRELLYPKMIFGVGVVLLIARAYAMSLIVPGVSVAAVVLAIFIQLAWGIGMAVVALALLKMPSVKRFVDDVLLNMPGIGQLIAKGWILHFARSLAFQYNAGIPISQAVQTCADIVKNQSIHADLMSAVDAVKSGGKLSEGLRGSRYISDTVVSMIETGEQTGELGAMLEKAVEGYEDDIEITVQAVMRFVRPVMAIVVFVIVLSGATPLLSWLLFAFILLHILV